MDWWQLNIICINLLTETKLLAGLNERLRDWILIGVLINNFDYRSFQFNSNHYSLIYKIHTAYYIIINELFLTKLNYYYLGYSNFWPHLYCFNHNVSADMSFGLLQVFHVELGNPHSISNWTLYLIHTSKLFQFI